MGIVEGVDGGLGLEGSGVITKIAPGVENLRVGDRVLVCDGGCLATTMVTTAKLCAKIPDELSFEDAATMPCVYSTVIHSLVNIGGLESGQSVLIHSACGGVGIAAIQICQMLGAEVSIQLDRCLRAYSRRYMQPLAAKRKFNISWTPFEFREKEFSIRGAHLSSRASCTRRTTEAPTWS